MTPKPPEKPEEPLTRAESVGRVVAGLIFVAAGAYVEWLSFGAPPKGMNGPPWVAGAGGLIFLLGGLAIVTSGVRAFFRWRSDDETERIYLGVFQAAMLWLFAIAFGGAALFAESGFSGGVTGSQTEGRIAFGIFAAVVGLLAIIFTAVLLGAIMARRQKK